MNKKLSIILPVHNERESLEIMIRLLNSTLSFENEIIVVYDDDNDNSIEVAKKLEKDFSNFRIVKNNFGKGVRNAIQQGVDDSKYDIILITAVDEIFPIIAIDKMLEKIVLENFDLEVNNFLQVCPKEMIDKLENPITNKSIVGKAS